MSSQSQRFLLFELILEQFQHHQVACSWNIRIRLWLYRVFLSRHTKIPVSSKSHNCPVPLKELFKTNNLKYSFTLMCLVGVSVSGKCFSINAVFGTGPVHQNIFEISLIWDLFFGSFMSSRATLGSLSTRVAIDLRCTWKKIDQKDQNSRTRQKVGIKIWSVIVNFFNLICIDFIVDQKNNSHLAKKILHFGGIGGRI